MKNLQQIGQAMLDQYGFFVLFSRVPLEIGTVETTRVSAGLLGHRYADIPKLQYKIVAEATLDDFAKQWALAGENPEDAPTWGHLYRAVAE